MSRYTDIPSSMQVLACIFKQPDILDNEKYFFLLDDFTEAFHRLLFTAMNNLYELGVQQMTAIDIRHYLEGRPKQLAMYDANKGDEYLQHLANDAQLSAFDYYYNRVKKFTLLRVYNEDLGMDLKYLYDIDNILDVKKKQKQEEWLDNTSLNAITEAVERRIENIKMKYVDNATSEFEQAGDGALELVQHYKETPEMGYPLFGSYWNTIFRGARLGKLYLRSGSTGLGKAIPNDTLIPTPIGWRKVGDIKEGDYLFGQDGKPTKVVKIHPQPTKKQVWEVEFLDGRIAECCEDHLWEYDYCSHGGRAFRTESVKQIVERVKKLKNGFRNADNKGFRFAVKLNEPLEYEEKQYSIPPYVMGAILGDGSLRYQDNHKMLEFSSADKELPDRIAEMLGVTAIKTSGNNYSYIFKTDSEERHNNLWVEELFKDYPELWNVKSEDKFIPQEYLEGSIEQRFELLQGLMDTDGSIDSKKGRTEFTTISPYLRDNVIELARSLGMIATYLIDKREYKYVNGTCFQIHIQAKKHIKPKMFKLSRKVKLAEAYVNNGKRAERKETNAIVDIRPTERYEEMTCFTVDNKDHLFLMNDFIVTHNTRSMVADACNFACSELYNSSLGKWVYNGTKEPTLYIATEQDLTEMQTMMIAFIADVDEEHILNGRYDEGEWDRIERAAVILEESPLFVKYLPDFTMREVESAIKMSIREFNVKYVLYDYIHSSMGILGEIARGAGVKGLREDNVLFMLAVKLKDICNQYGVFIESGTQLNGAYQEADVYDQNLLRGAKSLAD